MAPPLTPDQTFRRFERYGLDRVFGDLAGLEAATRKGRSSSSEGPFEVGVQLARHNAWVREDIEGTVRVANHTPDAVEAVLRWRIAGHPDTAGELPVTLKPHTAGPLKYGPHLHVEAPECPAPERATLELELVHEGCVLAAATEPLTVTPWESTAVVSAGPVTLRGDAQALEAGLLEAGFPLEEALGPGVLLVTTTLDDEARHHLESGGHALLIAEQATDVGPLSLRALPPGDEGMAPGWTLYMQPGVFGDLPVDGVMGWECEDLFPHQVVTLSDDVDPAGVLAGGVEDGLADLGAVLLRLPLGGGRLTVTTLRLIEAYGLQPVGTAMVHRLVALCAAEVATTSS